jgi:hypothetical protein
VALLLQVHFEGIEDLRERNLAMGLCILYKYCCQRLQHIELSGKEPTMWLPAYTSFSPVRTNQRFRQCRRLEPHFIKYPLRTTLLGSLSVPGILGVAGAKVTPCPWGPAVRGIAGARELDLLRVT